MPPNTAETPGTTITNITTTPTNTTTNIMSSPDNPQMPVDIDSPLTTKVIKDPPPPAAVAPEADVTTTPATTTTTTIPLVSSSTSTSSSTERKLNYHKSKSWREISPEPHFNIGLLIGSTNVTDRHVSAISKPASQCTLTHLCVLHPIQDQDLTTTVDDWLTSNSIGNGLLRVGGSNGGSNANGGRRTTSTTTTPTTTTTTTKTMMVFDDEFGGVEHISIHQGDEGWNQIIQSADIDAVYIVLPPSYQKDYVLAALKAGKHVLVNDPISTPLPEFKEELETAKLYGKFIQSSTMFVHQYRVQRFLNRALQDEHFGNITDVDASIQLSYQDVEKVGVQLPLRRQDGCIRVLGRYCVLVSTLFFNRLGSFAESARVNSFKVDEKKGTLLAAECTVKYTHGRQLHFYVAYIPTTTRQSIELKATTRYATMNDFVIEHPDGLATYRVYDRVSAPDGNIHVSKGDSIDVAMGMGQERVMWRSFVKLSCQLDEQGGWDDSAATAQCRELTNVALQTKKILIALMESLEKIGTDGAGCEEVAISIDDIEHV